MNSVTQELSYCCAHNMLRASIGINITPSPWNPG